VLILASRSPRRQQLLSSLTPLFAVIPSDAPEREPRRGEDPAGYVRELARMKAALIASTHAAHVVLAADTDVSIDGMILGKPVDADAALSMLALLRGREHSVTTAVVVRCGGKELVEHVTAAVTMRSFSDEEARAYVASGEPMDKAGSYAVQEFGGSFVESVRGCYSAVVGLPLCVTARLLRECGIPADLPDEASCSRCERNTT
jgi:septum formation protein